MCDLEAIGVSSIFKTIRSVSVLSRMLTILDLNCEEKDGSIQTVFCISLFIMNR